MRRRIVLLALILATSMIPSGDAGPGGCTDFPTLDPFAFESVTVSTTAIGFTAATFDSGGVRPADLAIVDVESQAVRYRVDGIDPTAAVGHAVLADTSLTVCGIASIRRVKFIRRDATDATLRVSYYRGSQ